MRLLSVLSPLVALAAASSGCFDEPTFDEPADTSGEIFFDGFPEGLDFQAFAGTNQANPSANALAIDSVEFYSGRASLRFIVPGLNDPTGAFAGGAFVSAAPRDLSSYNALSFVVKGSRPAVIDVAGFGNDNTGTSRLTVERSVPIGADWTEVVVPIPAPARLTAERGLFHFAEGADGEPPTGYTFWIDELQFVRLPEEELGALVPSIGTEPVALEVDGTANVSETRVAFSARPETEAVAAAAAWFDFVSADVDIATVDADGVIRGVGPGQTTITASVAGVPAAGALPVDVIIPVRPTDLPAAPSAPAADVLALFSDAYAAVPVDTFRADWSACGEVKDILVDGDTIKSFAEVDYVGIELITAPVDVTSFNRVHLDVWTPDSTVFKVKLVDFGADGVFGNDDSEHELTFTSSSTPALSQGAWVSFDLPLSSFTGLTRRATLAQVILSGSTSGLFVDNIYFAR